METNNELDHAEAVGLYPTVSPRSDTDPTERRRRMLRCAETAGYIAPAAQITGSYIEVAGLGNIDPIANWTTMDAPKALISPNDIRRTTATMKGRLSALARRAEARASIAPTSGPFALHPTIWSAAVPYWTTGKYRVAVRESAEALNADWKNRLDRHDVDDTSFWQQALSPNKPEPGRPRIVWPGDPTRKTNKSLRGGLPLLARALNDLATSLNLTIRNPTTHSQTEITEQEALEMLGAYSFLARRLDECDIQRHDQNDTTN